MDIFKINKVVAKTRAWVMATFVGCALLSLLALWMLSLLTRGPLPPAIGVLIAVLVLLFTKSVIFIIDEYRYWQH